jgi:glucosamine-6-phosphate deaminase
MPTSKTKEMSRMTIKTHTRQDSVSISSTREKLGVLAASHVAAEIRLRLSTQPSVRMIFAAAPSQGEMLQALTREENLDWSRVEAFHMDEYIGLPDGANQRFGIWLKTEFFDRVPLGSVNLIEPGANPQQAAENYAQRLRERPVDMVCLGIGVNGHLAFNDPPADFTEAQDIKVVELQYASRQQQVDDGLFTTVEEVPTHAITLSIPRLLRAERLFCCVPGSLKRDAVTRALTGSIDPGSPASILREHPNCTIYLDAESAAGLTE